MGVPLRLACLCLTQPLQVFHGPPHRALLQLHDAAALALKLRGGGTRQDNNQSTLADSLLSLSSLATEWTDTGGDQLAGGKSHGADKLYKAFLDGMRAEKLSQAAKVGTRTLSSETAIETASAMARLARALRELGRYDEAEALERPVLEICHEELGEHHPRTLAAMQSLATTLSKQRRFDEAEAVQRMVLEARRELLGDRHRHTRESTKKLLLP